MQPLAKIIVFLALCQVLQTVYLIAHAYALRGAARKWYLLKIAPLALLTLALALLVARIFLLIPYIGI